jgi:translation initiation factor eIF-2B subunit alpha
MFELMEAVKDAATKLKRHYSHNSVSLSAGCDVFYQFISSLRDFGQVSTIFISGQDISLLAMQDFEGFKSHIIAAVREYAQNTKQVKDTIADHVDAFIKDDSIVSVDCTFALLPSPMTARSSRTATHALW